jgi:hypothetical protein
MLRSKIVIFAGGALLFLAAAVAVAGAASDDAKATPQKPAAAAVKPVAPPAAASEGMRVFIDPATGKIREPEASEVQQLTPSTGLRAAPMAAPMAVPVTGPGGAAGLILGETQMVYSVATRNPDGSISFQCVTGSDGHSKAIAGKAPERRQSDEK